MFRIAILLYLFFISSPSSSFAESIDRKQYAATHNLRYGTHAGDDQAVERCLSQWGEHPFQTAKQKKYRVITTSVKVLGIGGDTVDNTMTSYPQLVLIEPSVNVLSKSVYKLSNPNGWYCFKGNVTVLAKSVIEASCKSRIADSRTGATILGSDDGSGKGGVTVLGSTRIKRDCRKV